MRRKFLGQSVVLNFGGTLNKGRIIDIEFAEGLGPLFLLQSQHGHKFWLTRGELRDHANLN